MISPLHTLLLIAVIALVTVLTRALPFLVWRNGGQVPPTVRYLGRVLPGAMMALLIVYALRNVQFIAAPHGLPELLAIAAVAALHLWKRNSLISILGGTVVYMLLVQVILK